MNNQLETHPKTLADYRLSLSPARWLRRWRGAAILAGTLMLCETAACWSARAGAPAANMTGYAGSGAWFDAMRKLPANESLVLALAKTNFFVGVPFDCVEVAGTVTFPDGNPFRDQRWPELNISCRDQGADPALRVPRLDDAGHFYTVFKRGLTYEFYWKRGKDRERFCTLQVSADAQQRQNLTIAYPPAESAPPVKPIDAPSETPRDRAIIFREYDMSGFPPNPGSAETKKIAEAVKFARSTSARASAHEMLARYYRDTKLDDKRAQAEFKKAEALKTNPAE